MGSYVLAVCLFNFIAGFIAAMYLHNPRAFSAASLAQRRSTSRPTPPDTETDDERIEDEASESPAGREEGWKLPSEWLGVLVMADVPPEPAIETVLHGLRMWLTPYRDQLVKLKERIEVAAERQAVTPAVADVLPTLERLNRKWLERLRESSELLQELPDSSMASELDDRINDYILQLEPDLTTILECNVEKEVRNSGVKWYAVKVHDLVEYAHALRDDLTIALALALTDSASLQDAPRSWTTDSVTELDNRIGFFQSIMRQADSDAQPVWLCAVRIDRFRRINESIGVIEGDRVLASFGDLLKDLLQLDDEPPRPARIFGATFVVFLKESADESPEIAAERVRLSVEAATFEHAEGSAQCTASCGLTKIGRADSPAKVMQRIVELLAVLDKSGGNHTTIDNDGKPTMVEKKPMQTPSRKVSQGKIEIVS